MTRGLPSRLCSVSPRQRPSRMADVRRVALAAAQYATIVLAMAAVCLSGCGGYYVLTAPDHVSPVGSEAPVVVRLQRNDFFVVDMAWKEAPVRFRVHDEGPRFAFTDDEGYAATLVPAPKEPGQYMLSIYYKDREGREMSGQSPVYIWPVDQQIVLVDYDSISIDGGIDANMAASKALVSIAERASIIYLTRRPVSKHAEVRYELQAGGFPGGPILPWERRYYRVYRTSWGLPSISLGSHMVSQLNELKRNFPNLAIGITHSAIGAQAFLDARMEVYFLGWSDDLSEGAVKHSSWVELMIRLPQSLAESPSRVELPTVRSPVSPIPRPETSPTMAVVDRPEPEPWNPPVVDRPTEPIDDEPYEPYVPYEPPIVDRPPRPTAPDDEEPVRVSDLPDLQER